MAEDENAGGSGGGGNNNQGNPDIVSITVTSRIPDFWKDCPRIWFIQVEAVINPQHLSDAAKYQVIISKLPKEVIGQLTDLLLSPPDRDKYLALKTRLLSIYEESESRKIQKLITEMELGDQKPSQLLRKMSDLARGKITDVGTLRVLWQNHLPTSVRSILAVSASEDLDTLAAIADKIMENVRPLNEVASVARQDKNEANSNAAVIAEIQKLGVRLSRLEQRSSSRSRSSQGPRGSRARSSSRHTRSGSRQSHPKRSQNDPDWLCYYHFRYKDKAAKCVKPCNWEKRQEN
ncbi:hypothetical protein O0L34_g6051 [Tuta absoluta]|nr:hypothetical protein O0L34_g6051 [Tuta absoluta]